jgi:hypothetical protein
MAGMGRGCVETSSEEPLEEGFGDTFAYDAFLSW